MGHRTAGGPVDLLEQSRLMVRVCYLFLIVLMH